MLDFLLLFFFKQKTAYELRISDWSSDVCSSDLARHGLLDHADGARTARPGPRGGPGRAVRQRDDPAAHDRHPHRQPALRRGRPDHRAAGLRQHRRPVEVPDARRGDRMSHLDALPPRSEEHTSELQTLMRIPYAVFCLKKNKTCKTT